MGSQVPGRWEWSEWDRAVEKARGQDTGELGEAGWA